METTETYFILRGKAEKDYFINCVRWSLLDRTDLSTDEIDKIEEILMIEIEEK